MTIVGMSVQDALWLTMDRPNNLMVVDSVVVLGSVPSDEEVRARFAESVERFPVLSRRPTRVRGQWRWEDDPDFDLDRHLSRVALPEPADMAELQRFAAVQRSVPLDKDRPLWVAMLVENVGLDDGSQGSAIVTRFHHAIADGVRLTQLLLGMCDSLDDTTVPMVARQGAGNANPVRVIAAATGEVARVSRAAGQAAVGKLGDVAASVGELTSPGEVVASVARLPRAGLRRTGEGIDLLRHPDRLLDAFEAVGGGDHRSVNDASSVTKLVLTDSDATIWTGRPGMAKDVAWSTPMSLPAVKRAAKARGATVNDILVSAVAGGLQRYLSDRDASVREVVWMVPVNLKPFEENLPADLGNYFALVMLAMPLHHESSDDRLGEIHGRMQRIKNSDEAVITFGLQRALSMAPSAVAEALTNFFANKAVGVLTNVPGPTGRIAFAGAPVRQVLGFAPCSGDQPMTATIFTYDGQVTIGFAGDRALVPDLRSLVDDVVAEVHALTADHG
jgi:diacylglycerol O-acyltransferase